MSVYIYTILLVLFLLGLIEYISYKEKPKIDYSKLSREELKQLYIKLSKENNIDESRKVLNLILKSGVDEETK